MSESMADDTPQLLDASGLKCPEPVMLLHKAIKQVEVGGLLKVIATDPSTERDIPRFCEFLHHQLKETTVESGRYIYVIQRGKKPS